jgi:hypothetical protein
MTNEEKRQILELIKRHIDEHDTVRVGWAAEQILKSKQQNHVLDKLSAAVTKTNVLLSSILTLAVGLILWLIDKKSQDQQLNLLKERLRKVETILNNQPSDSTKQ